MKARNALVLAVLLPALALGASACGGSSGGGGGTKTSPEQLKTMEAKWRAGLVAWRRAMINALDGLSLVFATNGSVADLTRRSSGASTRLTVFEQRILTCTDKLELLGPAPAPYEQSNAFALEACKRLIEGIGKVDQVVADLRHGFEVDPIDPLGNATLLLGIGQTELSTAINALDAPTA